MLLKLGDHIKAARERADKCNQRASLSSDQTVRAELIDLALSWSQLAESFELLKTMEQFLSDSTAKKGINPAVETVEIPKILPDIPQ